MSISWRVSVLVLAGVVLTVFFPTPTTVSLWVIAVTLLTLLDAHLAINPRHFTVSREVDTPIRADQSTDATIHITTSNPHEARVEVRDAWEPSLHPSPYSHTGKISAERPLTLLTRLSPERRGIRQAGPVTIRVWGPLGLGARQVSFSAPVTLDVLPEFRSRRLLPSRLARLQEIEGATAVILRGPGTEFDSLRDYVRGDDPRDIDWRASARNEDLVVRTWQPERDRHVLILLDTGRTSALLLSAPPAGHSSEEDPDYLPIGTAPRLDAGIEATLLLSGLADRAGDHVHVVAFDQEVRGRVSGAQGSTLMNSIATMLQGISPELQPANWKIVEQEVRSTLRQRSLVVVVSQVPSAGGDPQMLETLKRISRDHTVVVASASDPALSVIAADRSHAEAVYTAGAASAQIHRENTGILDFQRAGILPVAVESGFLAARLADKYIELKKHGLL